MGRAEYGAGEGGIDALCPSEETLRSTPSAVPPIPVPGSFVSLASDSSLFDISFSHSPLACNVLHVRIARTDTTYCATSFNATLQPSLDPVLNEHIKSFGPDSFRLVVDGAQKYGTETPTQYDAEQCSWLYTVQLRATGEVRVKMWWMYTAYETFHETLPTMPTLQYLSLLKNGLQLQLCSSSCAAEHLPTIVPSEHYSPEGLTPDLVVPLRTCDKHDHEGSFLAVNPLDTVRPPFPLPSHRDRPTGGSYTFLPTNCSLPALGSRFHPNSSLCTGKLGKGKKRKILMMGDSHVRVATDSLIWRLEGNRAWNPSSRKVGDKRTTVGNILIQYLWFVNCF